jgi:serine/threonine protein kinase
VTSCGPYQLLEQIGAGGSGSVYRALQPFDGQGEQVVAVKLLTIPPHPLWVEQLRRLAESPNPHVCPLLEVGQEGEQWYVVYPFLPGKDLETARQVYDQSRAPLRTVLRWGIDALKGLGAIHEAGFMHGDIKPSNLMLDEHGGVVVCDFTTLTPLQGALSHPVADGTPEFLPPPQGAVPLRSPQRDLYALALTLSALLLGRLPGRPEEALPSRSDPLLPTTFDAIIERALGLAEPFASAAEMRHAMEALLGGPPLPIGNGSSLSPPTRRVAWEPPAPRESGPLWPWALVLFMLPLGMAARSWFAPPPPVPVATALWSGIGVAPEVYQRTVLWQVRVLGRPVLAFGGPDPAAGDESARERAEWCAAVLEEAHFQKRPLRFAFRREYPESCDVYLVGEGWPEKFFFRVTPTECRLLDRKAPWIARAWCGLLTDTAELARSGSRGGGDKSPGALLLQPWQRRFETLAGQEERAQEQPARVALWLQALESLDSKNHRELMEAYLDLPEPKEP